MYAAQLRSKDDILAIRAAERQYVKRVQLAQETLKIVREDLAMCYRENGVNHKTACKGIREEYAKLIQDPTHGAGYPVDYREYDDAKLAMQTPLEIDFATFGDNLVPLEPQIQLD